MKIWMGLELVVSYGQWMVRGWEGGGRTMPRARPMRARKTRRRR